MKRVGWILAGYLLAVIVAAIMLFAFVVAYGPPMVETGVEKAGFLGKTIAACVVTFAPIYLCTRAILWLFSFRSLYIFALAFVAPCVFVFDGLGQVPDFLLIDWVSVPGDPVELVVEETMAAQLWGGYGTGPFYFTGLGVTFWCLAGACFGIVIWWSEGRVARASGASEMA